MTINPSHLHCEAVDPYPKGGQHVGCFGTKVKVTHIPTGLVVICDQGRSQWKSRTVAVSMIEWGLAELHYPS